MAFGVEEKGFRNRLVVAVAPFIGIAAVSAEEELFPTLPKLVAEIAVGRPPPNVFKRLAIQITQDKFFFRIIATGANHSIPMDHRVIPKLFARILFDPEGMLSGAIVSEPAVEKIFWEKLILNSILCLILGIEIPVDRV